MSLGLGDGKLLVNTRQKGNNSLLKHLNEIKWEYDDIIGDFHPINNGKLICCCYYLSLRYHLANSVYITERLTSATSVEDRGQDLQFILLLHIDLPQKDNTTLPAECLNELNKLCIDKNFKLLVGFTFEDIATYIIILSKYGNISAQHYRHLQVISEEVQRRNKKCETTTIIEILNSPKLSHQMNFHHTMNKFSKFTVNDIDELLKQFDNLKNLANAKDDDIAKCSGIGAIKTERLRLLLNKPFLKQK
ncbi:hypothetical protein SNEBB_005425 [Seison nebaliae]|nr:hypothetical protein SNEBB_005425 [Seison nebaliae]